MNISLYLDKSKKDLWSKLDPQYSVFINTSNLVDPSENEFNTKMPEIEKQVLLDADTLSKNLKETVQRFMTKLKSLKDKNQTVYLIVNKRKVIMQKIYYNLALLLQKYTNVKVIELDKLKGGTFTNPHCTGFLEPDRVLMVLTRNHNKKELNVLKELEKVKIPSLVLTLNIAFSSSFGFTVNLSSIKTLYLFLYGLTTYEEERSYADFVKDYIFETKELDFEVFNSKEININ